MTAPAPLLSLRGITKRFGSIVANDSIDLDLGRGEILAILGENGAGKTTLMNILFGHYLADGGQIAVGSPDGSLSPLQPGSPRASLTAGIGMVHQHFALAESLTVLENVVLGTEPLLSVGLRLRKARVKLERLIAESGLSVALGARVSQLSVGQKQRVEILKVLYRNARILVLDEPTAVLAPQEVERLFSVLRRLAASGLGFIFISHKLGEVLAIADRVAVLRNGRKVAEQPIPGADRRSLAALMVGREVARSRREPRDPGDVLLTLSQVTVPPVKGGIGLYGASLTIHSGEIVGIAGVSGNGQAALAGVIGGTATASAGVLVIAGSTIVKQSPQAMNDAGVGRIPEDRHRDGIVGALSIAENLALESLGSPTIRTAGFLRYERLRERAQAAIATYNIRCPGPETPVRLLSGGNIQKVILARVLDRNPRLILANQPTRGLDVKASAEVHQRLLDARLRGMGVILISEDLDELLALSDRIAVIAGGRLTSAEPVAALTRERIGLLMAGQAEKEAA